MPRANRQLNIVATMTCLAIALSITAETCIAQSYFVYTIPTAGLPESMPGGLR